MMPKTTTKRPRGLANISKAIIVDVPLEIAITATDIVRDVAVIVTDTTETIKYGSNVLKANAKAWHDKSVAELDIEADVRVELKDDYATAYKAQYKAQLQEMIDDMK